jgi:hypothetical protein
VGHLPDEHGARRLDLGRAIAPLTLHYRLNREDLLENLEGDLHLVGAVESP